ACSQATTGLTQSAYVFPCGIQNALAMGLLTVNKRPEPKNHNLSFLIGPPNVISISRYVPILSTTLTPCEARNGDRLSLCRRLLSKPPKNEPCNVLPPSLGTIFNFRPPVVESAVPP